MNILYLAHRIPYPPNKGDKIRSFNEIKFLSKEHNLYLAFMIDYAEDCKYLNFLKKHCCDMDYEVINPIFQKLKTLSFLFSGGPLTVPYFYSAHLQEAIDNNLEVNNIDAILCFSSAMAEYVFKSRHFGTTIMARTKLIMDFVDVDSDKWRMYSEFSPFPLSLIHRREWKRLREYDAKVGKFFDSSVFVSEKEVDLFKSFCPEARASSIPNGVDFDYFSNGTEIKQEQCRDNIAPTILFMGAMDYYPNEDAVIYFANEVMPLIREQVPTAQFVVVGSNPTKRVCELRHSPSVRVTGSVPDVRPYLAEAALFVAPFRIARGIQNKILEAMAAGVPVVARSEAVQGFGNQHVPLVVQSTTNSLAASVIELLGDEEKRIAMAIEAQDFVKNTYNWDINMAALQRFFREPTLEIDLSMS